MTVFASDNTDYSENTEFTGTDGETGQAAAGDDEETAEVTVTGIDSAGEEIQVTVPYKPERVEVLDLANPDILDNRCISEWQSDHSG